MPHTVYILSDLHLAAGREPASGEWDDLDRFRDDDLFVALLGVLGAVATPVELVIAGDLIDFPRIVPAFSEMFPAERLGASTADSLERTMLALGQSPTAATGHPAVFAALRRFMANGHSITIVTGERDIDLLWPDVWALVFDAIYPPGAPGELRRRAFNHSIGVGEFGRLYIEHGQEHDATCALGEQLSHPFAQDMSGTWRLRRTWGALFADQSLASASSCWLDAIRPATRAVLAGIRRSAALPPWALALALRFVLGQGAVRGRAVSASKPVWPLGRRRAAALVEALQDGELREYLERRLVDASFGAALEHELRAVSEDEWSLMAEGIERQLPLECVAAAYGAPSLAAAQRIAARAVLDADPAIGTVIMGHTHEAIDGHSMRLERSDGRAGYFFNCGAWASDDPGVAPATHTYLRCTPDVWGAYHVELLSLTR